MKNFNNSIFNEIVSENKVKLALLKNSNIAKFVYCKKNKTENDEEIEFAETYTDMSRNFEFYVRVILNVQLMNYNIINTFINDIEKNLTTFFTELKENNASFNINPNSAISYNGPKYENLKSEIITWINVDIPYIEERIDDINIYINKITSLYRDYCGKCEIDTQDEFYIAKFLMKSNLYCKTDDSFTLFLLANFQKPNKYVKDSFVVINYPKGVYINNRIDYDSRSNIIIKHNGDDDFTVETIFDDKVKICELNIQRFINKGNRLYISQFLTRTINIFKKDKNNPLIKKDHSRPKGDDITIRKIDMNFVERSKTTSLISDFVINFINTNGKSKIYALPYLLGKKIINKIVDIISENQANNNEDDLTDSVEEITEVSSDVSTTLE